MNDEEVKAYQAKLLADLQAELSREPAKQDPYRHQRRTFLESLVDARMTQHLSQAELARRMSSQQPVISRIESGHGNPSLNTLLAIAKALDADLMLEYKQ